MVRTAYINCRYLVSHLFVRFSYSSKRDPSWHQDNTNKTRTTHHPSILFGSFLPPPSATSPTLPLTSPTYHLPSIYLPTFALHAITIIQSPHQHPASTTIKLNFNSSRLADKQFKPTQYPPSNCNSNFLCDSVPATIHTLTRSNNKPRPLSTRALLPTARYNLHMPSS